MTNADHDVFWPMASSDVTDELVEDTPKTVLKVVIAGINQKPG